MLDFTLHRKQTGDGSQIVFEVNGSIHNELWMYVKEVGKKYNDYFRVRIDPPFQPRTTGPRSQSARFNGHCQDLMEQMVDARTGAPLYTLSEIREAMKRIAREDGYPTHMSLDGIEVCDSESSLSKQQMTALLRRQQLFADTHGYWLTEYDESDCPECLMGYVKGEAQGEVTSQKCPRCKGKGKMLVAYRSLQGRTLEEMRRYQAERGVSG